jgi:thioredoxin reductase
MQSIAARLSDTFDVAVIGGGAAGLSAAVQLGRSRRSVIVIDADSPRNAPAEGVHGFLTRDGMSPAALVEAGQREVAAYGGLNLHGTAVAACPTDRGFEIDIEDWCPISARRLLVSTGLVDELPDVSGLAERWGRDVIHCAYCHGWEVRDEAIGVLASGPRSVHQVLMFRQLSSDVILFLHKAAPLTTEQSEKLAARDVPVVRGAVAGLEVTDDQLSGLQMQDGRVVPRQVVVVGSRLLARSAVLDGLGLAPVAHPLGADVGEVYPTVDSAGATAVPGVWVAGNVSDAFAQVVAAAAQGAGAGAAINAHLIAEDTARAIAELRNDPFSPASEARLTEIVLGDHRHSI